MSFERSNKDSEFLCLNPYSTGRYSMSYRFKGCVPRQKSLNPYSTGRYSMRAIETHLAIALKVLILILLEDTL